MGKPGPRGAGWCGPRVAARQPCLPLLWLDDAWADGCRELVRLPVGGLHLVPPVVADAVGVLAGELAGTLALGGVDEAHQHSTSRVGDGIGQVAVIGDHHSSIHLLGEHVDE